MTRKFLSTEFSREVVALTEITLFHKREKGNPREATGSGQLTTLTLPPTFYVKGVNHAASNDTFMAPHSEERRPPTSIFI